MRTPPIPPFRVAASEAIVAEDWLLGDEPVRALMEDWDPDCDLGLTRRVVVDIRAVCASSGLPADAPLALLARWRADATRLGGSESFPLPPGSRKAEEEVNMRLPVKGPAAGGVLTVETLVVLAGPSSRGSRAAAARAGAILWRDAISVVLEGGAARFPMTATSFSSLSALPDGALWNLQLASVSFDTPFRRAVRVLVNSDVPGLCEALETDSGSPHSTAVRSLLVADISRSLIAMGLSAAEPLVPEEIEPETLGAAIMESISSVWPHAPITSLVEQWKVDRPGMETEIQACLRLAVAS